MDALFLLLLILATPSLLASLVLWACLLMAARMESPTPTPAECE
ncbi:MAG: hypothetical protein QM813_07045 [Verrucomicrobiota bacterium]